MRASNKKHTTIAKDGTVVELTAAQKEYADLRAANPTSSLAQIAAQAYPNANTDTIRQIVHQNERNTNIAIYSAAQVSKAKVRISELVDSKKEGIALKASQDILDRTEGKPIQRSITQAQHLIRISLGNLEADS